MFGTDLKLNYSKKINSQLWDPGGGNCRLWGQAEVFIIGFESALECNTFYLLRGDYNICMHRSNRWGFERKSRWSANYG